MPAGRLSRSINLLLITLLLADLAYSFIQHYHGTLDGDMAGIIVPLPKCLAVLNDPFAWHALIYGQHYTEPNRFVPFWCMGHYFKTLPFLLQRFTSPLDSIYIAIAIAKTAIQAILIYLMSVYISGSVSLLNRRFLLAALVMTPLFQTFGWNTQIGIIDPSVTYCFFYAAATGWLLLFFLPFFRHYFHGWQPPSSLFAALLTIPGAWAASFNGALNCAVMLLICPALLLCMLVQTFQRKKAGSYGWLQAFYITPRLLRYGAVSGFVFAALSFIAGRYNVEEAEQYLPLTQRYARLPQGIAIFLNDSHAPKLLLVALLLSIALLRLRPSALSSRIQWLALWLLGFTMVYVALLPLGGFRAYRPFIIRRDSVQPVLIGAAILYGTAVLYLMERLRWPQRIVYGAVPLFIMVWLTLNDRSGRGVNYCERTALQTIALTPGKIVGVSADCHIMAWQRITDYKVTQYNAQLLYYWHVFPELKYYYQQ